MQNFIKIGPVVPELQARKVYYSHWSESLFSRPSYVQTDVRWPKENKFASMTVVDFKRLYLRNYLTNFAEILYD